MFRRTVLTAAGLCVALSVAPAWSKSAFTSYGDVGRYALPAGAALLSAWKGDGEGATQLFASAVVTAGLTYGLKYAVDTQRPNGGRYSFPSGHTSFAFIGAAYVHERYGWEWGLPAELAAAAVGYSRVDAKAHHWYDVVASAGLAHLSAYFLVDHRDSNVTLLPMVGGRKPVFGIVGSLRF